ncbi:acetolactate decarboxylase [Acinetobacter sp. V91_7]|uniref:acetolactate decarboxylase n=1 Tax=unclassified Acinetobacter TaxID=196816 RepID=UPI00287EE6B2|nr:MULTISPECIES: acetolactate decarboxylase [unclassified Acinetobacter]MDS7927959.1 acetolactate decarboxylase [Acinetobacter sp. V102_4]MDS7932442.1 acetolactate decarboxylase [Acinetobacter sp. V91_4B]MDS7961415.1 acetolactate decarboxylase [Acinetobacter sp. V91_7]
MIKKLTIISISLLGIANIAYANEKNIEKTAYVGKAHNTIAPDNHLYQYGIADAFIEGLYKGSKSIGEIKEHGNFGLGAPDLLDGELILVDGKFYQTTSTGQTHIVSDEFKTPFSFVTFFKPDQSFSISQQMSQEQFFDFINNKLRSLNKMYAIKITGKFKSIRTRAFPPVNAQQAPYFTPLYNMMDKQVELNYENTSGTLVGYRLPEFLNGINIGGYHFHFLSQDQKQGGHVLGFDGSNLKIELAELKKFDLETPQDQDFQKFNFSKPDSSGKIHQVE